MGTVEGKKIIILLGSLELGGAERQALHLARYLKEQGALIEFWGFNALGQAAGICDAHEIEWRLIPFSWPGNRPQQVAAMLRLIHMFRKARPSVLLPYTMLPNVLCGLTWRFTGSELCVWNQRDEGLFRMEEKAERLAVSQTPCFVANSQAGAAFLVENFGVKRERVVVIHNGTELGKPQLDRRAWRARLGVSEDCVVACMVANLNSLKDHATLLRAWKLVVERMRPLGRPPVLLLAGGLGGIFGNTHEKLAALAGDLELGTTVRFLGQVQDIPGLLGSVDIGVFSSRTEGCPNGALECMAAALPIAATDIPGIREAVGPEGFTLLAAPGSPEALARVILELALNPEKRRDFGAKHRQRIRADFSVQAMCTRMKDVMTNNTRARRAACL